MGVPYDKVFGPVAVDDDGDPAAELLVLPVPTRQELLRFVVTGGTNGDKVNLYNRQLRGDSDILRIEPSSEAKAVLVLVDGEALLAGPGDSIVVSGNSVVGYNTTHLVVERREWGGEVRLVTDQAFTVGGVGGAAVMDLTALAALYRVIPEQTVANAVVDYTATSAVPFVNQDPKSRDGSVHRRLIYLACDHARTLRVRLAFAAPEEFV